MGQIFKRTGISVCCLILLASVSIASDGYADPKNMDPDIPEPKAVVGYSVDDKAVRYEPLVKYMQTLAQLSDRVTLTSYGKTYEGRGLYYMTITSKGNHKRLDEIKAGNAKLADPRKLKNDKEARKLLDKLPAVAWMGYSIHGDELSSTDAAMHLAYQLAAGKDKATRKLLDEVVVHIDPLMNPDGRERYLGQLEQLSGQIASSDYQSNQHSGLWSAGRGNHYLYDMNRDWLVQVQQETQARAAVILSWNPHLLVDSHEMGPTNTYIMDPPREPINIYYSDKGLGWRAVFGNDQSAAFDRFGWSYYSRDWYSDWDLIYTVSWANLAGAVGLLYEQAGVNGASVKQATGYELTYRESVHHQLVSSQANLQTLCDNRRPIMADFLADKQWAISDKGPYNETFLLPPAQDKTRLRRFVEILQKQEIEFSWAKETVKASNVRDIWGNKMDTKELPAGTLVVSSAQPRRRMLLAMLEFDTRFKDSFLLEEREDLESRNFERWYDVSAWNVPMGYGLESYWAAKVEPVAVTTKPPALKAGFDADKKSAYGYLMKFDSSDIYPVLVKLFDRQCHMRIAPKPFQFAGTDYIAGTVLLRSHENPEDLLAILEEIAENYDVDIVNVDTARVTKGPDLGSTEFTLLHKPRVALLSQWPVRSTSFGSAWYLLDYRMRLRVSPINIQYLGRVDLRKYNVLIMPDCSGLGRVFGDGTVGKLRRWVEGGGTLIAVGSSAAYLARSESGLSSVRLKRNVLDELSDYYKAVQREKDVRNVKVDFNAVWGTKPSEKDKQKKPDQAKDDKLAGEHKAKKDKEQLKGDDSWLRMFGPKGVFVRAELDVKNWLCFGLAEKMPLLFSGSTAFMSKYPIATGVRLAEADQLRMSGLLWPEARERLADTAFATTESLGNGQVILFANDPTFRSWLAAEERLFLNAVLLGPGMGSSPPMPW